MSYLASKYCGNIMKSRDRSWKHNIFFHVCLLLFYKVPSFVANIRYQFRIHLVSVCPTIPIKRIKPIKMQMEPLHHCNVGASLWNTDKRKKLHGSWMNWVRYFFWKGSACLCLGEEGGAQFEFLIGFFKSKYAFITDFRLCEN